MKSITITSKFSIYPENLYLIYICMPESRYSLGISGKLGLIDKSPGNISVVLDAAVAEEWPPAAHILAVLQVDIYHQALFFLIAGAVVELALRTGFTKLLPQNWMPSV